MDALIDTLWQEFAVETEEHLQAVEPILVAPDPQRIAADDIAQLFRSFHSIKGLARAMDVPGMESIAHQAENLLGVVRDGRAPLTPDLADLLLQSVDALKDMRAAVADGKRDMPAEPALLARLDGAFAPYDSTRDNGPPPEPPAIAGADTLNADPEMLAIFVEMVRTRGADLCGALSIREGETAAALDAAETLGHASEVMNFEALAASFGAIRDILQRRVPDTLLDEPSRREVFAGLGEIRLQIELIGEITEQDAGSAEFTAALAQRTGDERHGLALALLALNRRLREDLFEEDRLAAEADAVAMVRTMRTLQATMNALSLIRAADVVLLAEDIYGRIANGEIDPLDSLLQATDGVFQRIAAHAETGKRTDLQQAEAAELVAQLRAQIASKMQVVVQSADGLMAGLHIPPELLAVLSDEKRAELETGIPEGLLPYEILAHFEADTTIAEALVGWLMTEARVITNRTVLNGAESWLAVLILSELGPSALVEALLSRDPQRLCVKSARRLTASPEGELVLPPVHETDHAVETGAVPAAMSGNLLRVRGEVVDAFLDDIGELRVAAGALSHLIGGTEPHGMLVRMQAFADRLPEELRKEFHNYLHDGRERERRLRETEQQISGLLSRLHQSALELRVVPIDVVFNRMPRMVRDLAQQLEKSVELSLEGRDVRIDKSMVEALSDPLIHIVRNALDHGVEPPEERRAAGKPERAHLSLRAVQRGSEVSIDIFDDGRGLDPEAIRTAALAHGLISAEQAKVMSDSDAAQLIFAPGLSTASTVTETSGRGVGLDIVQAAIRRFDGDLTVRSEPGRGTTFSLVLPVSAALQTTLIVRVGDQSLAVPERHVVAVADIETEMVRLIGSQRSVLHREAVLPLFGLGELLGMPRATPSAARDFEPIVVIGNGRQMIGLEVDAIERRQELFLRDLDARLASFPGVGGASVLGDGRAVLVLDGEQLLQLAVHGIETPTTAARILS